MQKTKRRWVTPLVIIASAAIFAVSAFAASGNLSAYNTFKESLIGTMSSGDFTNAPENYTLTGAINASYDSDHLLTARTVQKIQSADTGSSIVTIEGAGFSDSTASWNWKEGTTAYHLQQNANDEYYRYKYDSAYDYDYDEDDDIYYSYDSSTSAPTSTEIQFVNALIDTVMGDTKNYFTTDGDYIVLNLEGGQIPELVQLGTSLVFESMDSSASASYSQHSALENGDNHLSNLEKTIASLKNHRLDAIYVRMRANDNNYGWISDTSFSVKLSGQDANGIRHSVALDGSMGVDQIGSTTADAAPDLTGKTVHDADLMDNISISVAEASGMSVGLARASSYTITTTDSE